MRLRSRYLRGRSQAAPDPSFQRIWANQDIEHRAWELSNSWQPHTAAELREAARLWDEAAAEWLAIGNRDHEARIASYQAEQCRLRAAAQQKEASNG